jgi:hypothetical protein
MALAVLAQQPYHHPIGRLAAILPAGIDVQQPTSQNH